MDGSTPAQANLGLRRLQPCQDFLTLAAWLALKEPASISSSMRCQLARLHGQLYSAQGKQQEALKVRARLDLATLQSGTTPEAVSSARHAARAARWAFARACGSALGQ